MNNVFSQLHRGLGLRFLLTVFASIGVISSTFLHPVLQNLQQGGQFYQGYHNKLINQILASDSIASFLPVLATIPLSGGYLEDIKSKASRFFLTPASVGV